MTERERNRIVTVKTRIGRESMTYAELCHRLGFSPEVNFVRVTCGQTVDAWCGKPNELRNLYLACEREGIMPSKLLENFVVNN